MMRSRLLLALIVLACITCRSREKAVAELQTRIANETVRLEKQLASIDRTKLPEDVAGLLNGYRDSFARIRNTKSAPLRLYRLRDTFIGIEGLAYFAAHRDAANSIESLNALVASRRAAYDAKPEPPAAPVLYRALFEQAVNRAGVLYRASAPYGKISDEVWGGLYYLGEAEGNLKFRDFVASLPADVAPKHEPHADPARLTAAANQLEHEALAFFEKDPVSMGAVPASAKLKEARELLAANLGEGATLALVEAKLALGRKKAEADPGSVHDGAKPQVAAQDPEETIPALLHAYTREGPPPVNVVVARDVLPFYASLLQPLAATNVVAPAAVMVTLVRWPYT